MLNLIGSEDAQAETVVVPNMMIGNFSTYENETLGIKIQYPTNWKITEDSNGIRFYDEMDPKQYEIAIYRYLSSSPSPSLGEEAANWINYYKQNLTNFKLLDSGSSTMKNASVYKISGTFDNKTKFKAVAFLSINGDDVFQLIYNAEIGVYDKWLKTAKYMMESLELSNASSLNGFYEPPDFSEGSATQVSATEVPPPISVNPLTNTIYTLNNFSDGIDVSYIYNSEIQPLDFLQVNEPSGIAIDTVGTRGAYQAPYGLVFVTSKSGDGIYVIEGGYNQVIGNMAVGNQTDRITVNPITNRIYVADCDNLNHQDQTISVICVMDYWTDGSSHPFFSEMTGSINLDGDINDISVNPQTNTIYVSKVSSDSITVINGSSNQAISNITIGNQPNQIRLIHKQIRYMYQKSPQIV